MEKYYEIIMRAGVLSKPIVISTSEQTDIYELIRFYRPELWDKDCHFVEVPKWALDRYLELNGEDSVDFI